MRMSWTTTCLTALCLSIPPVAAAQSADATAGGAPSPQQYSTATSTSSNGWLASGFVGSNFANNANPSSMDVGGSVAYLWKRKIGAEFDLGVTPSFQLQNNYFGAGVQPRVNSYMANAVWAIPLGHDGSWQPFVSGGAGAISLRAETAASSVLASDDNRAGGNVGGGVMGFAGHWGFKSDVRYYRASGTYNSATPLGTSPVSTSPVTGPGTPPTTGPYSVGGAGMTNVSPVTNATNEPTTPASVALSGLHFWRANVGLAVRW